MGGPSSSDYQRQNDITQGSLDLQKAEFAQSQKDQTQRETLMQPAISFNESIVGGDKDARMAAMAPLITNITKGTQQAKAQIMNETPPGAARDVALAETTRGSRDSIAQTTNQTYTSGLDKLANIGSGIGSFSLSEAGAAIGASESASSSNQALMQAKAAKKATTMGFLGELAGAGGELGAAAILK